MASLMGTYWTQYLNSATYGLFNASNLRVGMFTECNGGSGSEWGLTMDRLTVYETVVPTGSRLLYGTTSGPDGILNTAQPDGSAVDPARYTLTSTTSPSTSGDCPYSGQLATCNNAK